MKLTKAPARDLLRWLDYNEDQLARIARMHGYKLGYLKKLMQHGRVWRRAFQRAGWSPPSAVSIEGHTFESEWAALCALIGRDAERPTPKAAQPRTTNRRIICCIADTHGDPHYAGIAQMLDDEAPDMVVVAGDILDYFAYSRWMKDRHEPPETEVARVAAMLEMLVPVVADIRLIRGNHDKRREAYFAQRVEAWALGEIRASPLEALADQYENVTLVDNLRGFVTGTGHVFEGQFEDVFMVLVGADCVVAQQEVTRKHDGRSVAAFLEVFDNWRSALGMPDPRLVAMGHCHRAAVSYARGGHQVQVELGTMAHPRIVQWAFDRARLGSPPVVGYLVFEQERDGEAWHTDLASVRYQMV